MCKTTEGNVHGFIFFRSLILRRFCLLIQEGVFVYGLFLDGASWDVKKVQLIEAVNKVLYKPMPVVHIYAVNSTAPKDTSLYVCPVYKKVNRTDLNYITPLWLGTAKITEHWTLRAVAILCDIK